MNSKCSAMYDLLLLHFLSANHSKHFMLSYMYLLMLEFCHLFHQFLKNVIMRKGNGQSAQMASPSVSAKMSLSPALKESNVIPIAPENASAHGSEPGKCTRSSLRKLGSKARRRTRKPGSSRKRQVRKQQRKATKRPNTKKVGDES